MTTKFPGPENLKMRGQKELLLEKHKFEGKNLKNLGIKVNENSTRTLELNKETSFYRKLNTLRNNK